MMSRTPSPTGRPTLHLAASTLALAAALAAVLNLAAPQAAAAQAALHVRLVGHAGKPLPFDSARGLTFINSDLAF